MCCHRKKAFRRPTGARSGLKKGKNIPNGELITPNLQNTSSNPPSPPPPFQSELKT